MRSSWEERARASRQMPPALLRSRAPRLPFLLPSGPSISITSSHPWAMAVSEEPSCGWAVAQKWKGLGYEIAGLCAAPPVVLLSQRKRDRLDGKRETHPRTIFKAGQAFSYICTSKSMIGICKFQPCLRHSRFHWSSGTLLCIL